jgi:hypothetical protein
VTFLAQCITPTSKDQQATYPISPCQYENIRQTHVHSNLEHHTIIGQSSNTEDYFRFRRSTEQVWRALRRSTSLIFNILQLSSRVLI